MAITATTTRADRDDTSQQVLAARSRRAFTLYNDSDGAALVRLGAAATSSLFTLRIPANGYYEDPTGYDGAVHVVWEAAGSGGMTVTEQRRAY
jgi:hypothetical protein